MLVYTTSIFIYFFDEQVATIFFLIYFFPTDKLVKNIYKQISPQKNKSDWLKQKKSNQEINYGVINSYLYVLITIFWKKLNS